MWDLSWDLKKTISWEMGLGPPLHDPHYTQIRNYLENLETCNVHKLLQPCEVSNYHLFVISSANTAKNCLFTVKQPFK